MLDSLQSMNMVVSGLENTCGMVTMTTVITS